MIICTMEKPEGKESLSSFRAEIYDPASTPWEEVRAEIVDIEHSAFGDTSFTEDILAEGFQDADSIVVIMRDEHTRKIVGFAYALPAEKVYPEEFPDRHASKDTAYVYDVAFDPSHQHRGLLPTLMQTFENEIIGRGFSFLEIDAANVHTAEGVETYADKIRKNNRGRILKEEAHDSEYGPQVFFRIDLRK